VQLAEGVGFEPTETRNASPVFKTGHGEAVTCRDVAYRISVVAQWSRGVAVPPLTTELEPKT
jgi:hypothetical protein